jgi:ribosome assembly protein SQT1
VLDNKYRSVPHEKAKNPYTCGLSGKTYTSLEVKDRASWLARALHQELGFEVNNGTEWEKVIGIYAFNTVSYIPQNPSPFLSHSFHEAQRNKTNHFLIYRSIL